MGLVSIDFSKEDEFRLWEGFVHSHPSTHCADGAGWRLLFKELYGIDAYSYAYIDNDTIKGIISVYHISSPLLGTMLVSCPFFGHGGFYWDSEEVRDSLLEKIESKAHELKVDFIELRLRERLPEPYQSNDSFYEYNLDISSGSDEVWHNALSTNVRRNIRKSVKNKLSFTTSAEYRDCYRLLSETLRDHGTPFHGEDFFALVKKYFAKDVFFSEVRDMGKLVAAGVVIRFKNSIITPYIGSLKRYRKRGSNYCQYWGIINYCTEKGINNFEFGRSPGDSSHSWFKKRWGTVEMPVYYNYKIIDRKKKYRSVSHPTRVHHLGVTIWKRLPLALTRNIGPWIFRYIP
jgi:FemAB-related protein (PEP-CTERM system-associated)